MRTLIPLVLKVYKVNKITKRKVEDTVMSQTKRPELQSCRSEGGLSPENEISLTFAFSHFLSPSLLLAASVFLIVLFVFHLNPSLSRPCRLLSDPAFLSLGLSFSFCPPWLSIYPPQNEAFVLRSGRTAPYSIFPSYSSSSHLLLSLSFCVFSLLQPFSSCVWRGLW